MCGVAIMEARIVEMKPVGSHVERPGITFTYEGRDYFTSKIAGDSRRQAFGPYDDIEIIRELGSMELHDAIVRDIVRHVEAEHAFKRRLHHIFNCKEFRNATEPMYED